MRYAEFEASDRTNLVEMLWNAAEQDQARTPTPIRVERQSFRSLSAYPSATYPANRALIRAVEQPPGDDLGLDLGGTFENIENARIA